MKQAYYDTLAPYYKLIYQDWDKSIQKQAEILDSIIHEFIGKDAKTVVDVACGIGTQSIGLAKLGYRVTASDISSGEIDQARHEVSRHGVQIEFQVADMRQAWDTYRNQFDIVIACDNAVPHLLSENEILLAFRQFYECTKPGGGCIITVRDYTQVERHDKQKQLYPRLVHQTGYGQVIMFGVWDFDGDFYEITTYLVEDKGKPTAKTRIFQGGKYFCVEIPTLERLFRDAGYREVHTLRDRFFQPLIIAIK